MYSEHLYSDSSGSRTPDNLIGHVDTSPFRHEGKDKNICLYRDLNTVNHVVATCFTQISLYSKLEQPLPPE
jgi:hypothetical protein